MPLTREAFLAQKPDYSDFLAHLTRRQDDLDAVDVLASIMLDRCLEARNSHCLINSQVSECSDWAQSRLSVVCFTECRKDAVGAFCTEVSGRQYQVEPFGLYFKKSFLRDNGATPVFYAPWPTSKQLRAVFDSLLEQEKWGTIVDIFPFVSEMAKGNDWHWEREWRINESLIFRPQDVAAVFCPEDEWQALERVLVGEEDWDAWRDVEWCDPLTMRTC